MYNVYLLLPTDNILIPSTWVNFASEPTSVLSAQMAYPIVILLIMLASMYFFCINKSIIIFFTWSHKRFSINTLQKSFYTKKSTVGCEVVHYCDGEDDLHLSGMSQSNLDHFTWCYVVKQRTLKNWNQNKSKRKPVQKKMVRSMLYIIYSTYEHSKILYAIVIRMNFSQLHCKWHES